MAVRDTEKARRLVGDQVPVTTDGMDIVRNPDKLGHLDGTALN